MTVPPASAALGSSGEVAVALPTVQPEPVRQPATASAFTPSPLGSLSVIDRLADSPATCVTPKASVAPLSLASLVTVPLSVGAYARFWQPLGVNA